MVEIEEKRKDGTTTHNVRLFGGYTVVIWWGTIIAFVLCIIVLAAPGWSKTSQTHSGLWKACYPEPTGCVRMTRPPAWLKATQAMVCLSFIASIVSFVTAGIYMFLHSINMSNVVRVFTAASMTSAIFMFLGFVVFASKVSSSNSDLYYAFILAVVNFFFFCITSIAGGLQMKQAGVGILPTL